MERHCRAAGCLLPPQCFVCAPLYRLLISVTSESFSQFQNFTQVESSTVIRLCLKECVFVCDEYMSSPQRDGVGFKRETVGNWSAGCLFLVTQ